MVAILGNEQTRDQLVASLKPITNASLRHVAGQSIDVLTPKGSKSVAEKLRVIIDENAKSPDKDKVRGRQLAQASDVPARSARRLIEPEAFA